MRKVLMAVPSFCCTALRKATKEKQTRRPRIPRTGGGRGGGGEGAFKMQNLYPTAKHAFNFKQLVRTLRYTYVL